MPDFVLHVNMFRSARMSGTFFSGERSVTCAASQVDVMVSWPSVASRRVFGMRAARGDPVA